jgi:hypothetical protein
VTCPEEELIAEHGYTGLLSIVWQYNVSETRLELYTDSGKIMVFKASAAGGSSLAPPAGPDPYS